MVLRSVTWDTYERLLASRASSALPRLTYDRGDLELMSPLPEHERLNRAIQLLVPLVARQVGARVYSLGSAGTSRQRRAAHYRA